MTDRRCNECGSQDGRLRRGLCSPCYMRGYKAGALPPRAASVGLSPEQRVDRKLIVLPNGCWLWTGRRFGLYGSVSIRNRNVLVHRFQYARYFGPIPEGFEIDHLCREEICVNPSHLQAVTRAENMARSPFSAAGVNRRKTHCPAGHPYSAANIYPNRKDRLCRPCALARSAQRAAKRQAVSA